MTHGGHTQKKKMSGAVQLADNIMMSSWATVQTGSYSMMSYRIPRHGMIKSNMENA